ncbi:MAG: beta-galactosidase [Planctomycetota bacterium]|jgi:beta-galactosidase
MPTVTYNEQSFAIDNRPVWILGASMQYARIPAPQWADRIAAARQAGFNTIETACPWLLHEPRPGRYEFDGDADVRQFVSLCHEAGMRVILRLGPFVDAHLDGGGLPPWLIEMPELVLREANEAFFSRFGPYIRKLAGQLTDLQVTADGPILLVQAEHAWTCGNEDQANRYLREITRLIRESGFNVPIINANDLWQDDIDSVHTWRGWSDLLVHLRQFRTLQPAAPRLVSTFDPATIDVWGEKHHASKPPAEVMRHLAEVLASGAQPVVSPFHGGTNLGFLGGRLAGRPDGFITTAVAPDAPLGEAGGRGRTYQLMRRLVTFADHFGHVFAALDPQYQPIVLDAGASAPTGPVRGVSIVPLRGGQGRAVFVFADEKSTSATLLLDDGLRMPVHLGKQPCSWSVFDVDLHGAGRLDYVNLCPFAIVDRSILVLFGPEKSPVFMSVDQAPLNATVPGGRKPLVVDHKGLTVVICNQSQIDVTYENGTEVFVGVSGFELDGTPIPAEGYPKAWVISRGATVTQRAVTSSGARAARTITVKDWQAAPADAYASGSSPRYASLDGPQTLTACGAPTGYGWYRMQVKTTSAKKRLCHIPAGGHRLHVFADGAIQALFGTGPGAETGPFDLRLVRGEQTLVVLADNLGRYCEGNDLAERVGLFDHLYEVKPLRAIKPKTVEAATVDAFALRGFIAGRAAGQPSESRQLVWSFTHTRKAPILVNVIGAAVSGTFILNDEPIEYYAGASGGCRARLLLDPASPQFKRGKNVLRFAPDPLQDVGLDDLAGATTIYECVAKITGAAAWSFAKWEPPAESGYEAVSRNGARGLRGCPCWWRGRFALAASDLPVWLDTTGLSKGQVFLNGRNLGRYFTATADGRAAGPQKRLLLPGPWLSEDGSNEIVVFDEHGFDPVRTKVIVSRKSEFE